MKNYEKAIMYFIGMLTSGNYMTLGFIENDIIRKVYGALFLIAFSVMFIISISRWINK